MKRGRTSGAELAVISGTDRGRSIPQPPAGLGKAEAALFRELAAANAHLRPSDSTLLAAFAEAAILRQVAARAMHENVDALHAWEKAAKMLATLGTRLRLTPQSRTDSRAAGRSTRSQPLSYYETLRGDDGDGDA
jgi:phage terminase small subunit